MLEANSAILQEAIMRNAPIVLSLPSAGMLRHHKSRFLEETEEGVWAESVPEDAALIDELIATGQSCGVSFRGGETKVIFSAPALRRERGYKINDQLAVEAVLLRHPEEIKSVQRRANYRVHIPLKNDWLSARVWRIGQKANLADVPMEAQEIDTRIRDLSATGMGVILTGRDDLPPRVDAADRLRLELTRQGESLLLEGRLRYPTVLPKQPSVRVGIQFIHLENELTGRQIQSRLIRIVGDLQREEIRRYRLGLKD